MKCEGKGNSGRHSVKIWKVFMVGDYISMALISWQVDKRKLSKGFLLKPLLFKPKIPPIVPKRRLNFPLKQAFHIDHFPKYQYYINHK